MWKTIAGFSRYEMHSETLEICNKRTKIVRKTKNRNGYIKLALTTDDNALLQRESAQFIGCSWKLSDQWKE